MRAPMSDPHDPGERREDAEEQGDWVDRFVLVFVRESMLWPVLIVIIGHAVVFVAPVMLFAVRERRPAALIVFAGLCWGTLSLLRFDKRRSGKLSQLSALAGATWVLALLTAVVAHRTGIF